MNDLIRANRPVGELAAVGSFDYDLFDNANTAQNTKEPEESARYMTFQERFETIRVTPQSVADSVIDDDGVFKGLSVDGERYSPSQRFLKGLAQRMKVPLGVFELFTPLEVIRRAAERASDLPLRLTVDRGEHRALALVEDKGVPLPAGNIEVIMREDPRLQEFDYRDGVITGRFDLGEAWDIPGDSKYGVHISTEVPVDGMGTPSTTLATWRQVCSNGAVAEAPMFRTKMEVKDNGGEHFRRLLRSFSNPRGIELLHERLVAANGTKASVDEVFQAESFIRRQIRDSRHQMLLCERLQEVAEKPNLFHLPPFYAMFEDVYRHLYWLYGLCNHYGWSGTLPPVAMILNRSKRPTRVAGYANPQATAVNGQVYCGISLTLNICARGNTSSFIPILLHEMTHVWQFSKGQRGGHGKGFRDEMLRLGIDEVGQGPLRAGSPAVRIMQEAELRHPGLAARMRECLASPLRSTKEEDFAFFRMVLCHSAVPSE